MSETEPQPRATADDIFAAVIDLLAAVQALEAWGASAAHTEELFPAMPPQPLEV